MDREADVALPGSGRLARVDADPHPHLDAVRPLVVGERTLDRDRRSDGVRGAAEGDEERVALRVDLLAPMRGERLPQQPLLIGQQLPVAEPGRAA